MDPVILATLVLCTCLLCGAFYSLGYRSGHRTGFAKHLAHSVDHTIIKTAVDAARGSLLEIKRVVNKEMKNSSSSHYDALSEVEMHAREALERIPSVWPAPIHD